MEHVWSVGQNAPIIPKFNRKDSPIKVPAMNVVFTNLGSSFYLLLIELLTECSDIEQIDLVSNSSMYTALLGISQQVFYSS